jgi:hypothetical protein
LCCSCRDIYSTRRALPVVGFGSNSVKKAIDSDENNVQKVAAVIIDYEPPQRTPPIHKKKKNLVIANHLGGGLVIKAWTKRFILSVVLGSNPVIAHMMATGGLHGR